MNPFDELFGIGTGLLSGIRLDVATVFSGIIVIGFIMIGVDYLLECLNSSFSERRRSTYLNRSRELYEELHPDGDFDKFEKSRRLNRYLNKAHRY